MLTEEEKGFLEYWEANRLKRKRFFKQLAIGLPFGVLLVIAIFFSFFSGWHKQADIELRSQLRSQSALQPDYSTVILVLVVAALLIVVFTAVFSARHKWEMNEQRYRELLAKKE